LRGGIDVGPGLDIDENEIYGAVLVHAHRLESKHAEYPRALIGEGLLRYLSALETSEDPGAWKGHSAERASACHKIITRAPDDHLPMLHILAPEVLALGPHHHELPPKALQWAARERVSHAESNNTILMQRYDRLLKYFAACGYSLPAAVRQTT